MVAMGRIPAPLQFYVHRPLSRVHDVDDLRSCRERGTCPGRFLLSDLDTGDVIPGRLLQSWGSKRDTVRLYALDAD
jgi:hypothetical protein